MEVLPGMPRPLFLFLVMIVISGCSSVNYKTAADGSVFHPDEIILLDRAEVQQARLERFLNTYPSPTELNKIDYLISSIMTTESRFIRNREEYQSSVAARWLRWKMHHPQYKDNPILTARDFVERVADCSRRTGLPYEVMVPDGRRLPLQYVLQCELNDLEHALRERALVTALSEEVKPGHPSTDAVPVPMLMPAG